MSFKVLFLRGSEAQNNAYTGPAGEITIDTTYQNLRVHDGTTAGGHHILGKDQVTQMFGNLEGLIQDLEDSGIASLAGDVTDLQNAVAERVEKNTVGIAEGVASLDANGKIPLSQLSDSILGQVIYQGTWNATTNTPTLPAVPENKGDYYVISTGGTFESMDFNVGDWIISNGVAWEKIDNTDAVASVAGRKGNVVLTAADVNLDNVTNTSDADKPVSTAQQNALDLKANKESPNFTGVIRLTADQTKAVGSPTKNVFSIVDSVDDPLFQVRENGDTILAGVLTVNGTGDSFFAGNVNIGGSINVSDGSNVEADFTGDNLTLTGNLVVKGNTLLGDEPSDTIDIRGITTIDGKTTIKSDVTKAGGNNSTNAFEVVDSADAPLFEVKTNGDTTIAGVLTVNGTGDSHFAGNVNINGALTVADGATVNADFVGDDLTLNGNLVVKGNTTLGDAPTDTINIVGEATTKTQTLVDNTKKLASTAFVHNFFADVGFTKSGGNWLLDQGTM